MRIPLCCADFRYSLTELLPGGEFTNVIFKVRWYLRFIVRGYAICLQFFRTRPRMEVAGTFSEYPQPTHRPERASQYAPEAGAGPVAGKPSCSRARCAHVNNFSGR